jgi:CRP/FNR family cyclic AMP-dependent transcriptional regulator
MAERLLPTDWSLPPEIVRRVLDRARRVKYQAGEAVFHEGDPADVMYVVNTGFFAVQTMEPGKPRPVILSVAGRGDTFGELGLVYDDQRRTASVVALGYAEAFALPKSEVTRLRLEEPEVIGRFMEATLAAIAVRLTARQRETIAVEAGTRVRRRLAELASKALSHAANPSRGVRVPLTQEQLGDLAGVNRATVNAVLSAERKRGTITTGRGAIVVLDVEGLRDGPPGRE